MIIYSSDEFAETTQTLSLNVIESYRSWSSGLSEPAPTAAPDGDSIPNLLEYAFGGDPSIASNRNPFFNRH